LSCYPAIRVKSSAIAIAAVLVVVILNVTPKFWVMAPKEGIASAGAATAFCDAAIEAINVRRGAAAVAIAVIPAGEGAVPRWCALSCSIARARHAILAVCSLRGIKAVEVFNAATLCAALTAVTRCIVARVADPLCAPAECDARPRSRTHLVIGAV